MQLLAHREVERAVRDAHGEQPARLEQRAHCECGGAWVGKLVEAVPDRDRIEATGAVDRLQIAERDGAAPRLRERRRTLVDVESLEAPPLLARRREERADVASHLEPRPRAPRLACESLRLRTIRDALILEERREHRIVLRLVCIQLPQLARALARIAIDEPAFVALHHTDGRMLR